MIIQITFVFVSICALILRSFYTICWEEKQVNERKRNVLISHQWWQHDLVTKSWICQHFKRSQSLIVNIFLPANSVTSSKTVDDFRQLDVTGVKIFLQKKIQKKLSRLESARSTRVELDGINEEEEVFLQPKRVKFANNHKSTRHKKVKPDKS